MRQYLTFWTVFTVVCGAWGLGLTQYFKQNPLDGWFIGFIFFWLLIIWVAGMAITIKNCIKKGDK